MDMKGIFYIVLPLYLLVSSFAVNVLIILFGIFSFQNLKNISIKSYSFLIFHLSHHIFLLNPKVY